MKESRADPRSSRRGNDRDPVKLVVGYDASPERISLLKKTAVELGIKLTIVCAAGTGFLRSELRTADAYIPGWGNDVKTAMSGNTSVRWIQLLSAGLDGFLIPELFRPGLTVTQARGVHSVPMAEHAMAMLLAHTRNLHLLRSNQRKRKWSREKAEELYGKTLLVVGAGSIGTEAALRAKAFGMSVVGVSRSGVKRNGSPFDTVRRVKDLPKTAALADIVFCCLPHTPSTDRLIDRTVFSHLKPSVIFMNFGRGRTVDEGALVRFLRAHRSAAAILDVFETEPLDRASALWGMENVTISPHMSAQSTRTMEREFGLIRENLRRFLLGRKLLNVADAAKGY